MKKSNLQEKLIALYLRLNGYATTGLILQSPYKGQVEGEVDIIGYRFSRHSQPDRLVRCADELQIPTDSLIDIIIGEVKGGKKPTLQFNESLRLNPDCVLKLFNWIGVSDEKRINELIKEFMFTIQTKENQKPEPFPIVRFDNITIRPILFVPDKNTPAKNQPSFIGGAAIVEFCWKCFRPEKPRDSCATDYKAVNNWGEQFERLIGYFKDTNRLASGSIDDIYKHFNVQD